METVGLGLYFEDLPVGKTFKTVARTIQDADICAFINVVHMTEVLFTDMEFLKNESDIKGRLAPGSLSYCYAEGLLAQATMQKTGFAFLNMELNIENPAFAGDTIHVECEVIEARSKPPHWYAPQQGGKHNGQVLTYTPLRMIVPR